MRVTIVEQEGGKALVRVTIQNPPRTFRMPCENDEQARIYAQGVVDGARYFHSEVEVPFAYHREGLEPLPPVKPEESKQ